MDRLDFKILAQLQQNGRISLTELSEQVGISLSPCQRRLKQLEQQGVIQGYHSQIDPKKVGLNFAAIVFVTLRNVVGNEVAQFEQALQHIPEITQAQRLFGEPDYMLHIVSQSLETFQQFYDKTLTNLPNILRLSSTLVMKEVVKARGLPIEISK